MKKLKLLLFPVLAFATNSIFAESRTFDEVQTIANKTLVNSDKVHLADARTVDGDTVCYTFKGENGGYAIVSADTRVPALLAYSNDGEIYPEMQDVLDIFVNNIDNNLHQNMVLSSSSSELRATRITNNPIEPLLKKIAWGQADPFNLNTPTIDGKKTPVGCAATAVAQLLYYYRYPEATLSDIPAYTTATEKIEVAGVAKGTSFDWKNMIDQYEGKYTEVQAKAVSDLMSVVGAAVEMDYGADESYSSKSCAEELVNLFGYDPELIRVSFRSSYTFNQWSQLIYNELKNNRPVLMSGSTMTRGHRFLCDGIDKDGLFHINWGWNGHYDGYFDLAVLNPNTTTEPGSSLSNDGYTKESYIVYGIQPDNGKVDEKKDLSDVDALSVQYTFKNGNYHLFFSFANFSSEQKKIQIASGYLDEDGNVVKVVKEDEMEMSPYAFYKQTTAYGMNTSTFKEGKSYKVGLVESSDGVNWRPCNGFENVSYTFTVKDGVVSLVDSYELSASVEMTDFNYIGQYAHGVIHLSNSGTKEYYNSIYMMINSIDERPEVASYGAYVTSEAGDRNDVEFKIVPVSDTVYYWLMDVNMNVLDSGAVYKQDKEFKLVAALQIDTTDAGDLICRLDVKNEGDSYYDNFVVVSLNYDGGYYTIKPQLYLKPGEETVINTYIPNEFNYTRYSVYDCNSYLVLINDIGGDLLNSGEVVVNFTSSRYNTSDQTVVGNLVINNGTSEPHMGTYIIELDTTGDFSGTKLAAFTVDVPANSSENIPLSLFVGLDSCSLVVYREGDLRRSRYTMYARYDGKTEIEDLMATDNSMLKIWAMEGSIVAEAKDNVSLQISTIDGRVLVSRRLRKEEIFQQNFPSAIYIVNGRKIVVR